MIPQHPRHILDAARQHAAQLPAIVAELARLQEQEGQLRAWLAQHPGIVPPYAMGQDLWRQVIAALSASHATIQLQGQTIEDQDATIHDLKARRRPMARHRGRVSACRRRGAV